MYRIFNSFGNTTEKNSQSAFAISSPDEFLLQLWETDSSFVLQYGSTSYIVKANSQSNGNGQISTSGAPKPPN